MGRSEEQPEQLRPAGESVHCEAVAIGGAHVNQVGRDLSDGGVELVTDLRITGDGHAAVGVHPGRAATTAR